MANTHVVLEGVKEYTRDLIGTEFRDVAVDAADRAEAQAERAEAAADNAEAGIRDDTIAKQHLTPGLRDELDGKADKGHKHTSADITDAVSDATTSGGGKLVRWDGGGRIQMLDPVGDANAATKRYVDTEVAKKADKDHEHDTSDLTDYPGHTVVMGASAYGKIPLREPDSDAIRVGEIPEENYHAASKKYVDSRIQLVTSWPASPTPGVLYLMAED